MFYSITVWTFGSKMFQELIEFDGLNASFAFISRRAARPPVGTSMWTNVESLFVQNKGIAGIATSNKGITTSSKEATSSFLLLIMASTLSSDGLQPNSFLLLVVIFLGGRATQNRYHKCHQVSRLFWGGRVSIHRFLQRGCGTKSTL